MNKLISFYILRMAEEDCSNFKKIITNLVNTDSNENKDEALNKLLDNPLAFADFMSKYYNDCLRKKDNPKKLFSMTALNNPNIKLLSTMEDGFDYINTLSRSYELLTMDGEDNLREAIKDKHGLNNNQKIIILNGLKNMFKKVITDDDEDRNILSLDNEDDKDDGAEDTAESFVGGAVPEDIKIKKDIDNLLQTFLRRDSYNKVVSRPYKTNFKKYILNEFAVNLHAYYNGMSLLHTVSKMEGEKQDLDKEVKKSINRIKKDKTNEDDELMLLMLALQNNDDNDDLGGGGQLNLKKTKKKRLKNQKRNTNKKRTLKKGGSNNEEDKIKKILEQDRFKQFFSQNEGLKEEFDSLTNIEEKKLVIFLIYTRLMKNKLKLTDKTPGLSPNLSNNDLNLGLFYSGEINYLDFVEATIDEIKEALKNTIKEDNDKKEGLVDILSNYINNLYSNNIEKQFWFHILSIKPKNKINLKFPGWKILHKLSNTKIKSLLGLNE